MRRALLPALLLTSFAAGAEPEQPASQPPPARAEPEQPASQSPPARAEPEQPASQPPPARVPLKTVADIPLGRWPEGMLLDQSGAAVWVADSGERRLARVDLVTHAVKFTPVGRLPTELGRLSSGTMLALVETEKRLYALAPGARKARLLPALPDCPDAMAVEGETAFVLLWQDCSSVDSSVVRVDPKSGKHLRSPRLGRNAWDIATPGPPVVVAGSELIFLDPDTLAVLRRVPLADAPMLVRASTDAAFTGAARVTRVERDTGAVTLGPVIPGGVRLLELHDDAVYAMTPSGEVHVHDGSTLTVREVLAPERPLESPGGLAFHGEDLLVTTLGGDMAPAGSGGGHLLVLRRP